VDVILGVFHDVFDWTAIGTLALAVATFVSLFFARRSIKQTQQQIELGQRQLAQTQREIELSRKEVEEAHRPVLSPIVDTTSTMSLGADGAAVEKRPQLTNGRLYLPVRNIGAGPALDIEATIERAADSMQAPSVAPVILRGEKVAGLGETRQLPLLIVTPGWDQIPSFVLSVAYDDVAGKRWVTHCRFDDETGRYSGMTVGACERQQPKS
jgi:hypothetical protein